jgi:hypothetical protein
MRPPDVLHGRNGILIPAWIATAAGALLAQPAADPAETPPSAASDPAIPSLDDLLGLDEAGASGNANERALERKLSAKEAGEQFQQAVGLMGDAADRIGGRDLGLQTQRIQEEIIKRLDQVIEAAKQNQSGGGGSSRSSSDSNQNQQQPNQSSQQQQQQGQPGPSGESENMGPELTGTQLNPGVAPDGVTWGNLPDRAREAVSQGVSDRYSALYRRMTELYYRKLAEREGDR